MGFTSLGSYFSSWAVGAGLTFKPSVSESKGEDVVLQRYFEKVPPFRQLEILFCIRQDDTEGEVSAIPLVFEANTLT